MVERSAQVTRLRARLDHQKDAVVLELRKRDDLTCLAHIDHKVCHGMLVRIADVAPKDRVALLGSRGIELQYELGHSDVSHTTRLVMLRLHGRSPPSSPG